MSEVVEGVPTAEAARKLAEKRGLELPLTTTIAAVLANEISPKDALHQLMTAAAKPED